MGGKRVIKWNGLYDGRGGVFGGEYYAPSDCDNFWEFIEPRSQVLERIKAFKRRCDKHGSLLQALVSVCTCAKRHPKRSKRSFRRTQVIDTVCRKSPARTSKRMKMSTRPQRKKR